MTFHTQWLLPDISFRDEGFEISTPFTLRFFQRTGVAVLPARQVPARPGACQPIRYNVGCGVRTFATSSKWFAAVRVLSTIAALRRLMSGFWTSQVV
jgi:hypothetical protein